MQNPYPTKINDVRPEGHSSLAVIPRFMPGDYDRLQYHWKFEILFGYGYDRALSGQLFWAIDTIEVKAGPATLQPQVRDLNNNLITTPPGILLFNNWSTAPPLHPEVDPRYFERAVAGFTEGNGSIGWGFGGESWINAAEPESHNGGPFSVWASSHPVDFQPPQDRVVGSDCLSKIGWYDDHIVINPIFRIMRKAGVIPPTPGEEAELRVFDQSGSFVGRVTLENGEGSGGRIALFSDGVEQAYVGLE